MRPRCSARHRMRRWSFSPEARMLNRLQLALRAIVLVCVCAGAPVCASAIPSFAEVKTAYRSSDTLILDRHGTPLQTVRTDNRLRRADWVSLKDVSPALRHALLLSEDKRFYEHSGVDWSAVGAATWSNLWNT